MDRNEFFVPYTFSGEVTSDFHSFHGLRHQCSAQGWGSHSVSAADLLSSLACHLAPAPHFLSILIVSPWQTYWGWQVGEQWLQHAPHPTSCISPARPAHPRQTRNSTGMKGLCTTQQKRILCMIQPNSCRPWALLSACPRALHQDGCPKQQMTDCCLAQCSVVRRRVVRHVLLRVWKMHRL